MAEKDKKSEPISEIINKRFLEERKVFLCGAVDDASAHKVNLQLLYLESVDSSKPIDFYINTPGGSITAGMSTFDTIRLIKSPVRVIVTGMAASMGSILLSAPKKGNRFLYPHARVLIHQPLIMGEIVAPAVDISIQAQEMEKHREEINQILSEASGQPLERIEKDSDRDYYMNAKEAIKYGLADKIITHASSLD